jgi:hypothetical protein
MEITREWLDSISDDKGLTNGQQILLKVWCKEMPYVGKAIPNNVSAFLEKCKGYRCNPFSKYATL